MAGTARVKSLVSLLFFAPALFSLWTLSGNAVVGVYAAIDNENNEEGNESTSDKENFVGDDGAVDVAICQKVKEMFLAGTITKVLHSDEDLFLYHGASLGVDMFNSKEWDCVCGRDKIYCSSNERMCLTSSPKQSFSYDDTSYYSGIFTIILSVELKGDADENGNDNIIPQVEAECFDYQDPQFATACYYHSGPKNSGINSDIPGDDCIITVNGKPCSSCRHCDQTQPNLDLKIDYDCSNLYADAVDQCHTDERISQDSPIKFMYATREQLYKLDFAKPRACSSIQYSDQCFASKIQDEILPTKSKIPMSCSCQLVDEDDITLFHGATTTAVCSTSPVADFICLTDATSDSTDAPSFFVDLDQQYLSVQSTGFQLAQSICLNYPFATSGDDYPSLSNYSVNNLESLHFCVQQTTDGHVSAMINSEQCNNISTCGSDSPLDFTYDCSNIITEEVLTDCYDTKSFAKSWFRGFDFPNLKLSTECRVDSDLLCSQAKSMDYNKNTVYAQNAVFDNAITPLEWACSCEQQEQSDSALFNFDCRVQELCVQALPANNEETAENTTPIWMTDLHYTPSWLSFDASYYSLTTSFEYYDYKTTYEFVHVELQEFKSTHSCQLSIDTFDSCTCSYCNIAAMSIEATCFNNKHSNGQDFLYINECSDDGGASNTNIFEFRQPTAQLITNMTVCYAQEVEVTPSPTPIPSQRKSFIFDPFYWISIILLLTVIGLIYYCKEPPASMEAVNNMKPSNLDGYTPVPDAEIVVDSEIVVDLD